MYLKFLEKKQKTNNDKTKMTNKANKNVRSTWLDHMASEGIQ